MQNSAFDRDTVAFLVGLGGVWVSESNYASIQHAPAVAASDCSPQTSEFWRLGINDTTAHGERLSGGFWEDLMASIEAAEQNSPHPDLHEIIPTLEVDIGELWNKHRTLTSALDMLEDILTHPTHLQYGREWVDVLYRRTSTSHNAPTPSKEDRAGSSTSAPPHHRPQHVQRPAPPLLASSSS